MTIPPKSGDDCSGLAAAAAALGSDVIAIQEVDHGLGRSNNAFQTRDIAIAMGANHYAFAPSVIGSPDGSWRKADSIVESNIAGEADFQNESYGIGIVSKIPVTKWHRLDLGKSPFGAPIVIPNTETGKPKAIYIKDEPRLAIAAQLENGWTIINTHLSFVPGMNLFQLRKLKNWSDTFGEKVLLMGDLNLPGSIPAMGSKWQSLILQNTYPSWLPKVQFDYILSKGIALKDVIQVPTTKSTISDHLPLTIEIN